MIRNMLINELQENRKNNSEIKLKYPKHSERTTILVRVVSLSVLNCLQKMQQSYPTPLADKIIYRVK